MLEDESTAVGRGRPVPGGESRRRSARRGRGRREDSPGLRSVESTRIPGVTSKDPATLYLLRGLRRWWRPGRWRAEDREQLIADASWEAGGPPDWRVADTLARMVSRPPCRHRTRSEIVFAAVLLGAASAVAFGASFAAAQNGVLVRFVQAGPGPRQTVLQIDVGGSSTVTRDLVPTLHRSRHFQLGRPMLETLESRLLAADLSQLNARYGSPNPGGVFTVTTTGRRTSTVYAPASGPTGLDRLNLYLEQILGSH